MQSPIKPRMKNALIVDDHPSIRMAIKYVLKEQGFESIDECDNGVQAIQFIKKNKYHIVLLDIGIPGMDGISVISTVRRAENNTCILVFTSMPPDVYVPRCMAAGASGFVSKNDDMDNVAVAIKAIGSGYSFFPNVAAQKGNIESRMNKLTNRELDVLRKIGGGMTNNEIADNMCLSNKTISTYKTRIMKKLGVTTLADLIMLAKQEDV